MPSWLLDKFKKMADRKAQREMGDGGKVYYVTGGKMGEGDPIPGGLSFIEEANRRAEEARRADRRDARADGFRIEGDEDGSIMGVTLGSETTNRLGGVAPEEATMFLRKGKPQEPVIENREKEEGPKVPPPPKPPLKKPPTKTPEVDYSTPGGVQSVPNFKKGIQESGFRGQGTTGDLDGARFELVDDKGMLLERGRTKMEDLPDYITQDPTFKKLVEEANSTKYRQDIGRAEGRFRNPGGQAAQDLADIMNGVITLEEYKKRKNIESASFGFGGKVPGFGVKKKSRS